MTIDRHELDMQALAIAMIELADSVDTLRFAVLEFTPPYRWNIRKPLEALGVAIDRARSLAHEVRGCEIERKV